MKSIFTVTFNREIWRKAWLNSINELTSIELQTLAWLDKTQTNPHWSFAEFMCHYFDDLMCDFDYKYYVSIGFVNHEEHEALKHWHEVLGKYNAPNNNNDAASILKDDKWMEIIRIGEQAKAQLAHRLENDEKKILTGKIIYPCQLQND